MVVQEARVDWMIGGLGCLKVMVPMLRQVARGGEDPAMKALLAKAMAAVGKQPTPEPR